MVLPILPSGRRFLTTSDGSYLLTSIGSYILVMSTPLSFEQFASQPCLEPHVLVTIEPREKLSSWTALSGTSYTFKISAPKIIRQDAILSGIFADITSITQNSIALTQATDLELGDAVTELSRGTWRYDFVNDMVHSRVGVSGSDVDPSTVNSMLAHRKIHIGSKGGVYGGFYYEPRLDANSEIVFKQEVDQLLFGDLKDVGSGSLKIHNGDGIFDTIGDTWIWNNSLVKTEFGGAGMDYVDYETILTAISGDIGFGFNKVELPLRTINKLVSTQIPLNKFITADYTNMDADKVGTVKPVMIGSMTGIPATLTDTTIQKGQFTLADSACMSFYTISTVTAGGIGLTEGVDYSLSLTGCTMTILTGASIAAPDGSTNIRFSAKGPSITASMSYATSSDYLKYYGESVMFIYDKLLGATSYNGFSINDQSAKDVDATRAYPQAMMMNSQLPASNYIRKLEIGVLGRTEQTNDGVIQAKLFTYTGTTNGVGLTSIFDEEISDTFPDPQRTRVFSDARVSYGNTDVESNTFDAYTATDLPTRYEQLAGRTEIREVTTQLSSASDALSLAQDILFLSKQTSIKMEMPMTGIKLMNKKVGDQVKVNMARGFSSTGTWVDKIFEIQGIEKKVSPQPSVTLTLNDITTSSESWLGNRGYWSAYTNSWSTATTTEQALTGYWADDLGKIDSADETTQNIRVWS